MAVERMTQRRAQRMYDAFRAGHLVGDELADVARMVWTDSMAPLPLLGPHRWRQVFRAAFPPCEGAAVTLYRGVVLDDFTWQGVMQRKLHSRSTHHPSLGWSWSPDVSIARTLTRSDAAAVGGAVYRCVAPPEAILANLVRDEDHVYECIVDTLLLPDPPELVESGIDRRPSARLSEMMSRAVTARF